MAKRIQWLVMMAGAVLLAACGGASPTPDAVLTAPSAAADGSEQRVILQTSVGDITLSLDTGRAPLTVENFLLYARDGHYDDTIFHRVIAGFMIQGGGFSTGYVQKPTYDPVANEADNGAKNIRYSIAMARTPDPQSATAQFFINVEDNSFLDYTAPTAAGWGYAVFGRVVEGFDVVDLIAATATGAAGPFAVDAPLEQVVIQSVQVQ